MNTILPNVTVPAGCANPNPAAAPFLTKGGHATPGATGNLTKSGSGAMAGGAGKSPLAAKAGAAGCMQSGAGKVTAQMGKGAMAAKAAGKGAMAAKAAGKGAMAARAASKGALTAGGGQALMLPAAASGLSLGPALLVLGIAGVLGYGVYRLAKRQTR
ncbi:protein tyrosine phosphatase, receptor type, F-like protein [Magnetococcus marinus MC-1]|uniref:Protein tyrosine phosphatase, receptor type, F-like protein n=1 Tax=Magnetococcus marinus (strain ATCC BAA-1437 / JCM 17883 / MC-1) TaxID=156889 RepID=A0L879_MAGMM|nr:hypothetical protein [Magnetococcus marinus]ABK44172.1 protein tyrosine phosphatase, receptor type, F-like protein [Magnetococcus marinus MC-1]